MMKEPNASSDPHLEYVEASPDMRGILNTLLVTRTGPGVTESIMPAYSAQMFSFVTGSASIHFPDREIGRSGDLVINTPLLRAAPVMFEGPVLNVGASFTPLGWAAFSGLPADKHHDTTIAAQDIVPPEHIAPVHEALARLRAGTLDPVAYCRALETMIRTVCNRPERQARADHTELVAKIEAWLDSEFSPPVERLYAEIELGQRQVQRLCRRYFGVPPAQLVKRYRAIRAAMLLAHDELSDELRDEVIAAYFDQAHLIHDIRRYTGRTPRGLAHEALTQAMLNPEGHGETGRKLRKD